MIGDGNSSFPPILFLCLLHSPTPFTSLTSASLYTLLLFTPPPFPSSPLHFTHLLACSTSCLSSSFSHFLIPPCLFFLQYHSSVFPLFFILSLLSICSLFTSLNSDIQFKLLLSHCILATHQFPPIIPPFSSPLLSFPVPFSALLLFSSLFIWISLLPLMKAQGFGKKLPLSLYSTIPTLLHRPLCGMYNSQNDCWPLITFFYFISSFDCKNQNMTVHYALLQDRMDHPKIIKVIVQPQAIVSVSFGKLLPCSDLQEHDPIHSEGIIPSSSMFPPQPLIFFFKLFYSILAIAHFPLLLPFLQPPPKKQNNF